LAHDAVWAAFAVLLLGGELWINDALKAFLTGYLPSAGVADVGAFLGFRRK
jgi:hypothetical protein